MRLCGRSRWLLSSSCSYVPPGLADGARSIYRPLSPATLPSEPPTTVHKIHQRHLHPRRLSSLSMSARETEDNDEGEDVDELSATHQREMILPVEDYLHDVMAAIDPSHCIIISEQHRKKMVRCLLGYTSKTELNLKLQNFKLKLQWEKTARFTTEYLTTLAELGPLDLLQKAPEFQEGVQLQQAGDPQFSYQPLTDNKHMLGLAPNRFFMKLARGRHYQGQFARLLRDVAPNLLSAYQDIVEDQPDIELLRMLVLDESLMDDFDKSSTTRPTMMPRGDNESQNPCDKLHTSDNHTIHPAIQWKEQLLQLLADDFGKKRSQALEDGGNSVGQKSEMYLASFLERRHNKVNKANKTKAIVVSNVLIKSKSKHLRNCKQSPSHHKNVPCVILSNTDLDRMTSEFDALVLEKVGDKIRIIEVWEAKASLTPKTIADVLFKKVPAIQKVIQDPEAQISFCPRSMSQHNGSSQHLLEFLSNDNGSPSKPCASLNKEEHLMFPLVCHDDNIGDKTNSANCDNDNNGISVGVFGNELMEPQHAARRTQLVESEVLLGKSIDAVLEGLEMGYVSAPDIRPRLEYMIKATQKLNPMLVVPLSTN